MSWGFASSCHAAIVVTGSAVAAACGQTTISIESMGAEPEPQPEPMAAPSPGEPTTELPADPKPGSDETDAQAPDLTPAGEEPAVDLESELLAYFPFDEGVAGAIVVDASGNGHHGTPSANPPTPSAASPAVGFDNPHCLAFDGMQQLVDLGNPATLDVSGNVTIAAWVRPTAVNGYRNVVSHGFRWMPDQELSLRLQDGYYEFLSWTGPGQDHGTRLEIGPGDIDNWHHLAGVYNGRSYRLFRDGVLVAETEDDLAPTQVDAPWAIGGRSADNPDEARYFEGLIDEVRIYGRALSTEEVRALFGR